MLRIIKIFPLTPRARNWCFKPKLFCAQNPVSGATVKDTSFRIAHVLLRELTDVAEVDGERLVGVGALLVFLLHERPL